MLLLSNAAVHTMHVPLIKYGVPTRPTYNAINTYTHIPITDYPFTGMRSYCLYTESGHEYIQSTDQLTARLLILNVTLNKMSAISY
jgi:hypothetical protein